MSHFTLLTAPTQQAKLVKGMKKGVMSFALHLAPADLSGVEVCAMRTAACTFFCINTTGRGIFAAVQAARIRKTQWYFNNRESFLRALYKEIKRAIKYAAKKGYVASFRLNATSDIPWHRIAFDGYASIMHAFPDTQFYDYTKVAKRMLRETLPANYHLTFSLTEDNDDVARQVIAAGGNVAAIFRTKDMVAAALAADSRVVNGDETDIRYLDGNGRIVALYAKGTKAKRDASGMVRDSMPDILPRLRGATIGHCHCGAVLSAVTGDCVRGVHCKPRLAA